MSLRHRISAINDYATVTNLPNENSSVENPDDETELPQNAVESTSNVPNNTSPPNKSETSTQNLTPVI